jgi:hypothetical protein
MTLILHHPISTAPVNTERNTLTDDPNWELVNPYTVVPGLSSADIVWHSGWPWRRRRKPLWFWQI